MSNRRKLGPPPRVAAFAAAYRCPDCTGHTGAPSLGPDGLWHADMWHDDGCPVLDNPGMALSSIAAQAVSVGIWYVGVVDGEASDG